MTKSNGSSQVSHKRKNRRDINLDNLTDVERDLLSLLRSSGGSMTVKEIATGLFGPDVRAEAKGKESVRTVRNALRIPKAMGLVEHANTKGTYIITKIFREFGFDAALQTAASWKAGREKRRSEVNREGS